MKTFAECLDIGQTFQDYVQEQLYNRGIIAQFWCSKKYQIERGEGITGIEVKCDDKYKQTGNLFIEFRRWKNNEWIPTDLYRKETWLYVIGDKEKCWCMLTSQLKRLVDKYPHRIVDYDFKVEGFLLPIAMANRLDAKLIGE